MVLSENVIIEATPKPVFRGLRVALALQSAIAVIKASASAMTLAKGAIMRTSPFSNSPFSLTLQNRLSVTAAIEAIAVERGRGTGPIANHRFSQL